eukprot:GHUV01048124.1.p1 GENE.GHUV01048124.1~~GHUV01048124.1.p1  ORF type:complete len:132 (+),score=24.84 GHUV01048124.1:404-799(+)
MSWRYYLAHIIRSGIAGTLLLCICCAAALLPAALLQAPSLQVCTALKVHLSYCRTSSKAWWNFCKKPSSCSNSSGTDSGKPSAHPSCTAHSRESLTTGCEATLSAGFAVVKVQQVDAACGCGMTHALDALH